MTVVVRFLGSGKFVCQCPFSPSFKVQGCGYPLRDAYHDNGKVVTMGNTLISGSKGKEEIRAFAGRLF